MQRKSGKKLGVTNSGLLIVLVMALLPTTLHAWGAMGHRIVAEVAQRHLELDATGQTKLSAILDGRRLAELATWPDDIRSDPSWSCAGPLHYVTIPPGTEYFQYNASLPKDERPEGDALRALVYYETVLTDASATLEEKRNALSFLIHIVGDLHEPLHNGRGCDRGGNSVSVNYFGEDTNLHVVWDEKLIESEHLSFTEFAEFVDHPGSDIAMIESSSPMEWVQQSQSLLDEIYTCDSSKSGDRCTCFCGNCPDGRSVFGGCQSASCSTFQGGTINLKYGYKARNSETLHAQLLAGGVRLAAMLNWIFSETPEQCPGYDSFQRFGKEIRRMKNWQAPVKACMTMKR